MNNVADTRVIPDSDEAYDSEQPKTTLRRSQSLAAVVIPVVTSGSARRATNKQSTISSSSSPASSPGTFMDTDTPATSIAVTPVESVLSSKRVSRLSAQSSLKRTRSMFDLDQVNSRLTDNTADDAILARQLQEEEYGDQSQKKQKISLSKRRHTILDSDDDVELSPAPSDIDDQVDEADDFQPALTKRTAGLSRTAMLNRTMTAPLKKNPHAQRPTLRHAQSTMPQLLDDDDSLLPSDDDADASFDDSMLSDSDDADADAFDVATPSAVAVGSGAVTTAAAAAATTSTARIRGRSRRSRAGRFENILTKRQRRERAKLEHAHPEIKTMWDDLAAVPKIATEQAEQPESITRTLKSFQLEGLNWMRKQEQTKWRGGLLGDEMGMGKTIQAVSLIMSDHPAKAPTLVAVPPVALMQWSNEINEYTGGKLKVLIYHGQNPKVKKLSVKELKTYDVIMISYPGLESIYRKETKGWTRGENIIKEDSAIHAIKFHRLILDEAHSIKSRTTGVAKACFALKGEYKWCLSGTPVQNRIGEFFSLLRFLEIKPFANYFCKSCPCSTLHWSVNEDMRCTHCSHRSLDHVSVFNQEILNPLTTGGSDLVRKEAMGKLRMLTDRIMLRRLKRDNTSSMVCLV